MNFRTIQNIINEHSDKINVSTDVLIRNEVNVNSTRYVDVENYSEIMKQILIIEQLGFIDFEINELKESNKLYGIQTSSGAVRMDVPTFEKFKTILHHIQRELASIEILLNQQLPNQDENSLTVELPNYHQYTELTDGMKMIEKIFQLALPDKAKEQIKIQNFDSGSLWLEIGLASSAMLGFIGGMVKIVSIVFVKIQQSKISVQQVNEAISDSEQRQAIKTALTDKLLKDLEKDSISFLHSQGEENPSPERINEVAKAFELLGALMDQGANFTPAYTALDSVKETFPSQELIKNLPTTVKQVALAKQILLDNQANNEEAD